MRLYVRYIGNEELPSLPGSMRATDLPDNLVYASSGHPVYLEFRHFGPGVYMFWIGKDNRVTNHYPTGSGEGFT